MVKIDQDKEISRPCSRPILWLGLMVIRERSARRRAHRVLVDLIKRNLNGLFKLRVMARAPDLGINIDLDIRWYAFILDTEFALSISKSSPRSRYAAAIDQR